jgi:hypothetical protein
MIGRRSHNWLLRPYGLSWDFNREAQQSCRWHVGAMSLVTELGDRDIAEKRQGRGIHRLRTGGPGLRATNLASTRITGRSILRKSSLHQPQLFSLSRYSANVVSGCWLVSHWVKQKPTSSWIILAVATGASLRPGREAGSVPEWGAEARAE